MPEFSVAFEGMRPDDLVRALPAVRAAQVTTVKEVMAMGKFLMIRAASGSVLKIKSGTTVQKISGGTIAALPFADGVRGSLRFFARITNIMEGGAHPKGFTTKPSTKKALKFMSGGSVYFSRGHMIPARTIKPHRIIKPAMKRMQELAGVRLPVAVENALDKVIHAAG